ncbi:MAG: aromatic amino acid transport family protein [Chlamydiota bacterium]
MNRFLGSILLVAGTAIGAGMLALPVSTGFSGFLPSVALFVLCWIATFLSALFFLQVLLVMKKETSMISMAGFTLGKWGKGFAWVFYLLLLYSLTAAYISAFSPMFLKLFYWIFHVQAPTWVGPLPFLGIFGLFVYLGTASVDWVNRIFLTGKILFFLLFAVFLVPDLQVKLLRHIDMKPFLLGLPVVVTAFGFHTIIPSLATYLDFQKKKLQIVLFVGSLFSLLIYITWEYLVLGSVPPNLLFETWKNGGTVVEPLTASVHQPMLVWIANFFAFFAIITSFLGVSLGLVDFLRDGFHLPRRPSGRLLACVCAFIPPLFFVYIYPKGFILALEYAGAFVAILLIFFPALMVWKLKDKGFYNTGLGKAILLIVMGLSLVVFILDILDKIGILRPLLGF